MAALLRYERKVNPKKEAIERHQQGSKQAGLLQIHTCSWQVAKFNKLYNLYNKVKFMGLFEP
jgi:hypothetical protein